MVDHLFVIEQPRNNKIIRIPIIYFKIIRLRYPRGDSVPFVRMSDIGRKVHVDLWMREDLLKHVYSRPSSLSPNLRDVIFSDSDKVCGKSALEPDLSFAQPLDFPSSLRALSLRIAAPIGKHSSSISNLGSWCRRVSPSISQPNMNMAPGAFCRK